MTDDEVFTVKAYVRPPAQKPSPKEEKLRTAARKIAEQELLGRPLRKGERVFFLDGDPTNTATENLTVISRERKVLFTCLGCGQSRRCWKAPLHGLCPSCRRPPVRFGLVECPQCGRVAEIILDLRGNLRARSRVGYPNHGGTGWPVWKPDVTSLYGHVWPAHWEYEDFKLLCATPFCRTCLQQLMEKHFRIINGRSNRHVSKYSDHGLSWGHWRNTLRMIRQLQRDEELEKMREEEEKRECNRRGWQKLVELARRLLDGKEVTAWEVMRLHGDIYGSFQLENTTKENSQ